MDKLPDHGLVSITKHCKFRSQDGECCNSRNDLRPWKCTTQCVYKLELWLQEHYQHLSQQEVMERGQTLALAPVEHFPRGPE